MVQIVRSLLEFGLRGVSQNAQSKFNTLNGRVRYRRGRFRGYEVCIREKYFRTDWINWTNEEESTICLYSTNGIRIVQMDTDDANLACRDSTPGFSDYLDFRIRDWMKIWTYPIAFVQGQIQMKLKNVIGTWKLHWYQTWFQNSPALTMIRGHFCESMCL